MAVIVAVMVVVVVAIIALLSRFGGGGGGSTAATAESGGRLLKAAGRWSVMGESTNSPLLALMHTVTAKAYVNAVRELMSDAEVLRRHRTDPKKMLQTMEKREQKLLRKITAVAPTLIPEGEHVARTGWIG